MSLFKTICPSRLFSAFIVFLLSVNAVLGQTTNQEKMKALDFMIGEWVGTSTVYENGIPSKQVPAFERIRYDLDGHIVVIELNSSLLQLHTIIHYDDKDGHYYYYPFSKHGVGKSRAVFKDEKLIVQKDENTRFVFGTTSTGGFREYGEKLIDGKWVKYFEDMFQNSQ